MTAYNSRMSEPTPELMDSIEREKRARAQTMSPLKRLLAGPELFDAFLVRHVAGLRHQHPEAEDQQLRAMLSKRVAEIQRKDRPNEYP